MTTRLLTHKDEVTPLVSEAEWRAQYPCVDREYIWIYPLVRREFFDPLQVLGDAKTPLLSLDTVVYIHVPACFFHCPMCPFYKEMIHDREDLLGYADAVIRELELYADAPITKTLNLRAIYFGGGTATTLYPKDIGHIISRVLALIPSRGNVEITVEGHPNVVDYDYLSALVDQGVNRVSFGIQSFQEKTLKILGLHQTPERNRKSLRDAIKLGFNTVSMDLLYRVPNQTIRDVETQLDEAFGLGVNSLSAYSLELSVSQWKLRDLQSDETTDREMFYRINEKLISRGWHHTAQPDYAAPGHINQEIITTWQAPQGQWFSLGAGAWSTFNGAVYCSVHDIAEYQRVVGEGYLPVLTGQTFGLDDAMSRYAVLGTRCFDIPNEPFRTAFGNNLVDVFGSEIRQLEEHGLISINDGDITVTHKGKYYVDNISKTFYSIANECRIQPWGAKMKGVVAPRYKSPVRGSKNEI